MYNPFFRSCVQLPETKPGRLLYVGVPRVDTGLQLANRQPEQPMPSLRTSALAVGSLTSVYQIDDPMHELYSFGLGEQAETSPIATVELVQAFSADDLRLLQTAFQAWGLPYRVGNTERKTATTAC